MRGCEALHGHNTLFNTSAHVTTWPPALKGLRRACLIPCNAIAIFYALAAKDIQRAAKRQVHTPPAEFFDLRVDDRGKG